MPDPDHIHALPAGLRGVAGNPDLPEDDLRVLECDPVVVDHQDAQVVRVKITLFGFHVSPVGFTQRHGDGESGPLSLLALHVDAAVHQFHDALRDRHAQTCTSVPAGGGGILLAESLKKMRQEFFAHADAGVADDEPQGRLSVIPRALFDGEIHVAAGRGELDGVPEDIQQYLLELHGVADVVVIHMPLYPAVVV